MLGVLAGTGTLFLPNLPNTRGWLTGETGEQTETQAPGPCRRRSSGGPGNEKLSQLPYPVTWSRLHGPARDPAGSPRSCAVPPFLCLVFTAKGSSVIPQDAGPAASEPWLPGLYSSKFIGWGDAFPIPWGTPGGHSGLSLSRPLQGGAMTGVEVWGGTGRTAAPSSAGASTCLRDSMSVQWSWVRPTGRRCRLGSLSPDRGGKSARPGGSKLAL